MSRRSAATAALVTLALGLPARPQGEGPVTLFAGPPDQEVQLEADTLVYGWEKDVLRLEGHVIARRGGGVVRAAAATLDRPHGLLTLRGGVLGVQGKDVFLADAAVVDLNARTASLDKAVLYLKERPANPDQPTAGKNALILRAARVRQVANGVYAAEEVTLTPCDCAGEPDYELLARTATIEGDRAHLSGTRLRLFGLPLPLFPVSLPLTQRQSGLLAPVFAFTGSPGFSYSQPVFLTLGRSFDLTLTPGYYTGGSSKHSPALGERTVRGPALGLEWRYAPAAGTEGQVAFDLLYDRDQRDSPHLDAALPGEQPISSGRGFGGLRGTARFQHRSEGSLGVFAVQGAVASDVMALSDFSPASLARAQDSLRTDLGLWQARGPVTVGLDATLLQSLRLLSATQPDRRLFGAEATSAFQRLPAIFAQVAPTPLGPALFSAEASAVQFLAFTQPRATERTTGFAPESGSGASLEAGDVSRAPALRFDLSPRLAFLAPARLPLDLRLEIGGRADAWIVEEHSDRRRTRAYGLADAYAGLPLERAFAGGYLHRIEPSIEVRALTRPLASGGPPIGDLADAGGAAYAAAPEDAEQGLAPGLARRAASGRPCSAAPGAPSRQATCGVPSLRRAYDEIDSAAPSSGAVEAVFSLSQSLWAKGRGRVLRFDLTQDALLWAEGARARLGEASAGGGVAIGPFSADAGIRWDWSQHAISAIGGSARIRDARGDELHAGAGLLGGSSSERLRAGIDELFSAARLATAAGELQGSAGIGGSAALPFNLRVAYDLARTLSPVLRADLADWVHSAVLSLETPCHCAGLLFSVAFPFRDGHLMNNAPTWHLSIDLKSLGSFATY